jgi:hypothetical protein
MSARASHVYYCKHCGSQAVECTAWINMNTDEISSSGNEGPTEGVYCPACEEHGTLADVLEGPVSEARALARAHTTRSRNADRERSRSAARDDRRASRSSNMPAFGPSRPGFRPYKR